MDPHLRKILWKPWDRLMGYPECTQILGERWRWPWGHRRRNKCVQKTHATLRVKKKRSPGWPGVLGHDSVRPLLGAKKSGSRQGHTAVCTGTPKSLRGKAQA